MKNPKLLFQLCDCADCNPDDDPAVIRSLVDEDPYDDAFGAMSPAAAGAVVRAETGTLRFFPLISANQAEFPIARHAEPVRGSAGKLS